MAARRRGLEDRTQMEQRRLGSSCSDFGRLAPKGTISRSTDKARDLVRTRRRAPPHARRSVSIWVDHAKQKQGFMAFPRVFTELSRPAKQIRLRPMARNWSGMYRVRTQGLHAQSEVIDHPRGDALQSSRPRATSDPTTSHYYSLH